eukprot:1242357-Amphidinium_carterae.1
MGVVSTWLHDFWGTLSCNPPGLSQHGCMTSGGLCPATLPPWGCMVAWLHDFWGVCHATLPPWPLGLHGCMVT